MKKSLCLFACFLIFSSDVWSQNTADSLHLAGNKFYAETKYKDAIQNWKASAAFRQRDSGEVNLNIAKSYRNISLVSQTNLGDYQTGVEYGQKAHDIRLQILGEYHKDVADSYSILANAYLYRANQGDLQKARELFEKAIGICLKLGKSCEVILATIYFDLGNLYKLENKYPKALEYFLKSFKIRINIFEENSEYVSASYNGIGVAYLDIGSLDSAMLYLQKALAIRLNILGTEHLDVAISYNNLGNLHFKRTDFVDALACHQKALNIQMAVLGNTPNTYAAASYTNIGTDFDQLGDYYKALEFYQKALAIQSSMVGEDHFDLCSVLSNIGQEYHLIGDDKNAILYAEKALNIRRNYFGEEYPELGTHYNTIGLIYESQKEFEKALPLLQKALSIRIKGYGENHPLVAESYNNMGTLFANSGDFNRALITFAKAMNIQNSIFGNENPNIASTLFSVATVYMSKKEWEKAREYFKKSLKSIRYTQKGDFFITLDINLLIKILNSYSVCYLREYKMNGNPEGLLMAQDLIHQALGALDNQRINLKTEGSQNWLAKQTYEVYEQAIFLETMISKKNSGSKLKQDAFAHAEQSKSHFLQSQITVSKALKFSGIDTALLNQERNLRIMITWRTKLRQELLASGKSELDAAIFSYNNELFDLRQQYDQLIQRFETEYPAYYRLKYELRTETVETVQHDLLESGETLLEYFTGDSSIFIFVVQKERYEVVEVPRDFPLEDWINSMRSGITDWFSGKIPDKEFGLSRQQYIQAAYNLYQKLIAPVNSLIPNKDRIIIIPDGVLTYIPFEALISEMPTDPKEMTSYQYWTLDHDISYCFSATLLREMRELEHHVKPTYNFLGIAPTYGGSKAFVASSLVDYTTRFGHKALKFNDKEVDAIQKIIGGQVFTGQDATEQLFCDTVWCYRIVHTALHSEANDRNGEYSYLAFYETPNDSIENEWLYVREVYNLRLNADMVVLSACQTGLGELRRGEGVIGLTRAFTYAGAKSIFNTLWSIDDKWTSELMAEFYKNLKSGQRKDSALANAKRSIIINGRDGREHPAFWAGFIGVGDMRAIGF
jgi:CHAT domain-containing protein/Tfp pilus assembly protein PilF